MLPLLLALTASADESRVGLRLVSVASGVCPQP